MQGSNRLIPWHHRAMGVIFHHPRISKFILGVISVGVMAIGFKMDPLTPERQAIALTIIVVGVLTFIVAVCVEFDR
jgi:hypothetical protein